MKLYSTIVVTLIIITFSCSTEEQKLHPMVDGRNTEWSKLEIEPIRVSKTVNLYIFQNDYYVWIAYDFPEGSFGTLDMVVQTNKLKKPLNIHVSAQLGEWLLGDEENIPKVGTSDLWWNHDGWIANNLWANGIDTTSYETPEFKIRNGEIRELQLSKERFGTGEWKFKMEINAVKDNDGELVNIEYPVSGDYFSILVK